jgi:hypothetical protein
MSRREQRGTHIMPENNGEVKGEQLLVDIRAIDVDSRPASHMRVCLNKDE